MRIRVAALISLFLFCVSVCRAHDVHSTGPVVVDTDMGLDDAVTLALMLQSPRIELHSIVLCDGVLSREEGAKFVRRMLVMFNREDVHVFAGPKVELPYGAPSMREGVIRALKEALPSAAAETKEVRDFAPKAYLSGRGKTTVVMLGPLTNLAEALRAHKDVAAGIERVVVPGRLEKNGNWNVQFHPASFDQVLASGLPLTSVEDALEAPKPGTWAEVSFPRSQSTSLGGRFLRKLLEPEPVRMHYTMRRPMFDDELVFVYLEDPHCFVPGRAPNRLIPRFNDDASRTVTHRLANGRQEKHRVLFVGGTLPDAILQEDVRSRKAEMIRKNGEVEWFAQLLMNELHEHLGAYSVIGVKMGLRAAELLNAPTHGMKIVSHAPERPPVSCVNDGLIVATGSTPGRGLFEHQPDEDGGVRATFSYNGRRITLSVKSSYAEQVRDRIAKLVKAQGGLTPAYWAGVRAFGLEIWQDWHRLELFEVAEEEADS